MTEEDDTLKVLNKKYVGKLARFPLPGSVGVITSIEWCCLGNDLKVHTIDRRRQSSYEIVDLGGVKDQIELWEERDA